MMEYFLLTWRKAQWNVTKVKQLKNKTTLNEWSFLIPKIKYSFPSIKYPILYQIFGEKLPKNYLYLEGKKKQNRR